MWDGAVAEGLLEWIGLMGWSCGIEADGRSVFFRVRDDGSACGWWFADAAGGDVLSLSCPWHRYDLRGGIACTNR